MSSEKVNAIDAQEIFQTGEGFLEACRILNEAANQGFPVRTLVMAVNASLALEAYLKCLLFLERQAFDKTHDLKKLFNALQPQTQAQLRKEHDQHAGESGSLQRAKEQGFKVDLDSLLESGKDAFVYFRYAFEGRNRDVHFGLNGLTKCVRERILALKPEWKRPLFEE
jgi:hypothetical protein